MNENFRRHWCWWRNLVEQAKRGTMRWHGDKCHRHSKPLPGSRDSSLGSFPRKSSNKETLKAVIDRAKITKPISAEILTGFAGPLNSPLWLFSSFCYIWALTELCSSQAKGWGDLGCTGMGGGRAIPAKGCVGRGRGRWSRAGQGSTSQNTCMSVSQKNPGHCQGKCCLSFKLYGNSLWLPF